MFAFVTGGERVEVDDLIDVLVRAEVDDPVYVPGRGWMLVGDLRLTMVPGAADLRRPLRMALP